MPTMHSEEHINMVCVLTCKPIFISIAGVYYLLTKTLFFATSVITIRLRPAPDKWSSCLQHLTILEAHLTRIEIPQIFIVFRNRTFTLPAHRTIQYLPYHFELLIF